MIENALKLFESFDPTKPERWDMPFPMGVFGTLRKGRGNDPRMHAGKVAHHCKAFMPHFVAHGLSISYRKDSSAVFEIYFYEPEEWKKMIPGVDSLEGFSPRYAGDKSYGYYRTLAWLHVLPDDYTSSFYEIDRSGWGSLGSERTLGIPTSEWEKYPRVPCWVYSNKTNNNAAIAAGVDTVISG